MSHFNVAVISKTPDQVKALLAPYQENNMGDCPGEFLEFFEVEGEYLEKYQNETTTMVKTPDGRLILPWAEELRVPGTFGYGKDTHMLPEGYEKVEVKLSDLYPAFEDYMKEHTNFKRRDPEKGKYGYWENPNAKWDYWDFVPLLRLKNGQQVATAKIKDVDFAPDPERYQHAVRFWEVNVEGASLNPGEDGFDFVTIYTPQYFLDLYGSKEEYAKHMAIFIPWALVTPDGKWHEKGKMGWWAMHDATRDSIMQFTRFFEETIRNHPDCFISMVDCHI